MDSSEKKQIPLNIEKCELFKPKLDKNLEQTKKIMSKYTFEEKEELMNIRRKSSTCSSTNSKIDDLAEITSISQENINITQEILKEKEIFFGRDKNFSNPIYNFYQSTEEYFQERLTEKKDYIYSKNFISKKDLGKIRLDLKIQKKNVPEKIINQNLLFPTKAINNNISNTNFNNYYCSNMMPALMGTYISKASNLNNGGGKFDMPMYYIGFCKLDSKLYYFILNFNGFSF